MKKYIFSSEDGQSTNGNSDKAIDHQGEAFEELEKTESGNVISNTIPVHGNARRMIISLQHDFCKVLVRVPVFVQSVRNLLDGLDDIFPVVDLIGEIQTKEDDTARDKDDDSKNGVEDVDDGKRNQNQKFQPHLEDNCQEDNLVGHEEVDRKPDECDDDDSNREVQTNKQSKKNAKSKTQNSSNHCVELPLQMLILD
jgi:hypothetical protein